MTMNGHFALKSVMGLASHGFVCCFKTELFEYLHSYVNTSGGETVAHGPWFMAIMSFMRIHWGSLKRERQTAELCSQLSHLLFTNI